MGVLSYTRLFCYFYWSEQLVSKGVLTILILLGEQEMPQAEKQRVSYLHFSETHHCHLYTLLKSNINIKPELIVTC